MIRGFSAECRDGDLSQRQPASETSSHSGLLTQERLLQLELLQVRENELSAELDRVRRTKNNFQHHLFASLQTEEAATS